jgi:hypothetical protein
MSGNFGLVVDGPVRQVSRALSSRGLRFFCSPGQNKQDRKDNMEDLTEECDSQIESELSVSPSSM